MSPPTRPAERGGTAGSALDAGLAGLADAYRDGLDPAEVVAEVVRRIDADDDGAVWIHREPLEALVRAAADLGPRQDPDRPLWGAPFAVKDNIDVAGRPTTCALPGPSPIASRSATVVERLLAAGALYVGKTNLDQLATGLVGTRSPYGTPRNPFDDRLVPGGSSSGSAVAVARGHVTFALGTDTAGSGRVPAALCGVVGAKGAPGTRPLDGVVPASPTLDCVSTFTSRVADALVVESVLSGRRWPVTAGPLRAAAPAAHPATSAAEAILRDAGHSVDPVDLAPFHEAGDLLYGGPWLAERTSVLAPRLARASGVDPVVAEVVAGGHAYRGTEVFEALARLRALRKALEQFWAAHDVLVVPTVELTPTLEEVAADPIGVNSALGRNTTFANMLGLAAIAVPDPVGPGGVTVLAPPPRQGAIAAVALALAGETAPAGTQGPQASRGHLVAVVGAHLWGQPLNHQLTDRGAELVERTTTSAAYRLHRLAGGPTPRPGLERVATGGARVEVEVWRLDDAALGALVGQVAPPLGIGSVELADERWVHGFICEPIGLTGARDITSHGGWRAYLASTGTAPDGSERA